MTKTTKELAFDLYSKGYSIAKIAEILHKNVRTIANYKNKEWDMERANFFTQLKGDRNEVYHNFTEEMYLAIREIREDGELNAEKKPKPSPSLGIPLQRWVRLQP